jgi:hypothetical protein
MFCVTAAGAMAQRIPAGTVINVRTIDRIESKEAQVGRNYRASLAENVVVNGRTVAARGDEAQLQVVENNKAGKLKGNAELVVTLVSVRTNRRTLTLNTENSTTESGGKGKSSAIKTGVGAGIGAAIGAIAGGGKGAAIGAGVGAGAGAGVAMMSGPRVEIPSETLLSFTVR